MEAYCVVNQIDRQNMHARMRTPGRRDLARSLVGSAAERAECVFFSFFATDGMHRNRNHFFTKNMAVFLLWSTYLTDTLQTFC